MAEIVRLFIAGLDEQIAAACESVAGLVASFDNASDGLAQVLSHRFVSLYEGGDLFVCEAIDPPARGACVAKGFKFLPSDAYREFVTAIADQIDGYAVRVVHDWPVLCAVIGLDGGEV